MRIVRALIILIISVCAYELSVDFLNLPVAIHIIISILTGIGIQVKYAHLCNAYINTTGIPQYRFKNDGGFPILVQATGMLAKIMLCTGSIIPIAYYFGIISVYNINHCYGGGVV